MSSESNTARIVEGTIHRCSRLATLPAVALQIIRLSEDPDSTLEDLNKVIANDPALGVRILKLVNSAYYGMPGQVNSLQHALLLLGLQAVKNIAIAASLVKMFRGGKVGKGFDARDLWTHSIAVATCVRMLAQQSGVIAEDEAFLAGLIHDLGIVVEMQACDANFDRMIEKLNADEGLKFRAAEQEFLGASHEAFGAGLCRVWNFPLSLQLVCGYHHRPWDLAEPQRQLPTLVHIADVLVAQLALGYIRTVETNTVDEQLLASVNLTEAKVNAVSASIPEAMREVRLILSDGK